MDLDKDQKEQLAEYLSKQELYKPSEDPAQKTIEESQLKKLAAGYAKGGMVKPMKAPGPTTPKAYDRGPIKLADGGMADDAYSMGLSDLPTPDPSADSLLKSSNPNPIQPVTSMQDPLLQLNSSLFTPGNAQSTPGSLYSANPAQTPPTGGPSTPKVPYVPASDNGAGQKFFNDLSNQANKYGPSQQAALYNALQKAHSSGANLVGKGLAGLGDAIMQGVARAGKSDFLSDIENREQNQDQTALENMRSLNQEQEQSVQLQLQLAQLNPKTPLNANMQKTYGPLLKQALGKLGITGAQADSSIANMTNEDAQKLLTGAVGASESQARIAELQNSLQQQALERAGGLQQKEPGLWGTLTAPFTGSHSAAPEINALNQRGGLGVSDQRASSNVGPYGATVVRNGKTYVWSPVSGKYHPQ